MVAESLNSSAEWMRIAGRAALMVVVVVFVAPETTFASQGLDLDY